MICGKHLFGVIQCSRGIGDFNLRAHENIPVKPFLSSRPCIVELRNRRDTDDSQQCNGLMVGRFEFLIVATDGLWDAISHEDAVNIVRRVVARGSSSTSNTLTLAACALVRQVRRKSMDGTNRWEGSLDDISVFVIPLDSFGSLCRQKRRHQSSRLRRQPFFSQFKWRSHQKLSLSPTAAAALNVKKGRNRSSFSSTPKHRDRGESEEYGLRWETCVNNAT